MNWKWTVLACLAIAAAAAAAIAVIFRTEPTAQREGATRKSAMLVEVVRAKQGTFRPTFVAMGAVAPAKEIILSPRVDGAVIERAPGFVPGGLIEKDTVVFRLDPADYEHAIRQRKSDLRQAMAELRIELGRQDTAKRELRMFEEELRDVNKALVLRKPQLHTVRARAEAARAALDQAELALQRTTITAPFDAHVISADVNVGSLVSAGDRLGRMVGLDTYWVTLTVPTSRLRWLEIPTSPTGQGAPVSLRDRAAWADGATRTGRVMSLVGELGDKTRLARLLVAVDDPLARGAAAGKPPLMVGAFLEAKIRGKPLERVVRVAREHVRKDSTVWVMEDEKLRIVEVDIAIQDAEYAYIRSGLAGGARIVVTNLATVTDGAALRIEGDE